MADSRSDIDEDDINLAKAFVQRAKADMRSAEALLNSGSYADSAYHAQQCAEKMVKSLLILENQFLRTHIVSGPLEDIIDNIDDKEWKINIQDIVPLLEDLERHWNLPRYPEIDKGEIWNPVEEYKPEDARDAIEKAKLVLETLTKFIEEYYHIEL